MDLERKVAASVEDLIGAARTARERKTDDVDFCGLTVRIAPCRAADWYGIKRRAANLEELADKPYREQVESQLAWVVACVQEPKIEPKDAIELSNAAPADFEKLAAICEHISTGQPASIWALGIITAHVCSLYDQADEGSTQRAVAEFWGTVLGTVYQWLQSADATTLPDFSALAETLKGEDTAVEAAVDAARAWSKAILDAPKNASAAPSEDASSEPPSSGPTDIPAN